MGIDPKDIKAQVVQLDNGGKPDQEVVLYCKNYYALKDLLIDPSGVMQSIGKDHYNDDKWNLLRPATAILRPLDGSVFMMELSIPDISFDLGPAPEHAWTEQAEAQDFITKGGFIAQFAKGTHTLLVSYVLPEDILPRNEDVTFTPPVGICAQKEKPDDNKTQGTVHFDIKRVQGKVKEHRAIFVVDHIANPDNNTWKILSTDAAAVETTVLAPIPKIVDGSKIPVNQFPKLGAPIKLKQRASGGIAIKPIVIIEGFDILDDPTSPTGPVVCLQSGAVRVCDNSTPPNCHWEINGIIVKNYTE